MKSDEMIERVQRYIKSVSTQDIEAIKGLYDEDAALEDPVGTDPHVGIEAICAFYQQGFAVQTKLELTGPVRCAGNSAAFPFTATFELGGKKTCIDVIDIFEFNDERRIQSMRAYWGPENFTAA
jgi:steroid delta-isomerase